MELIFHPGAARDARDIASQYASISERLEQGFWEELDQSIDLIAHYPERYHFDMSGFRRANLKRFPFHVLFEQGPALVRIMVVRHNHRNPSYGMRRR